MRIKAFHLFSYFKMNEEHNFREGRTMPIKENRLAAHTYSPPSLVHRQRTGSSECQRGRVNFHERNIEHLKVLKEKKHNKLSQIEEKNKKLEQTRERLAKIVLKRSEIVKKAKELEISKEQKIEEEAKKEEAEETKEKEQNKKSNISAYFRSRYVSLLKTIQETNKNKLQQRELEELKKQKIKQKLKEEIVLTNVSSKLYTPTVSSLCGSNSISENDLVELKGQKYSNLPVLQKLNKKKEQVKPAEDDKEKLKIRREAAEKIKKRALEHLLQIADKKEQEARKELEAKKKEEKLIVSLREVVLGRNKNNELAKEEIKEEPADESDESDSPAVKKVKKSDENALKRLSQAPKR